MNELAEEVNNYDRHNHNILLTTHLLIIKCKQTMTLWYYGAKW